MTRRAGQGVRDVTELADGAGAVQADLHETRGHHLQPRNTFEHPRQHVIAIC
jgi:hypothetical protein